MGTSKKLCPTFKDRFITDDRLSYGLNIHFLRDEENKVKFMKAGDIKYEKIERYSPDYSIPAKWQRFIGDYGKTYNILRIFVKDGKLTCLIEWFYEYPLKQVDNLVFAFPNYGLYDGENISFEENENKEIIAVIAGFVLFEKIKGENK